MKTLPISGIIPTINREAILKRTLLSISKQNLQPAEIIIIDASDDFSDQKELQEIYPELKSEIKWLKAKEKGAAKQRNQGVSLANNDFILFMDDDIILEDNCIEKLWIAVNSEQNIGGANAMITNQRYTTPGFISRNFFRVLNGKRLDSYAGKVIGPALNLLPEDNPELSEIVDVEWLNTTCTIYKKEALPFPPFPDYFEGYSLMEDLTLSLIVGKKWKLVNARTARIFHDSQTGLHKSNVTINAKMDIVNRFYVMTKIHERNKITDYFKFFLLQVFQVISTLISKQGRKIFADVLKGKFLGTIVILRGKV